MYWKLECVIFALAPIPASFFFSSRHFYEYPIYRTKKKGDCLCLSYIYVRCIEILYKTWQSIHTAACWWLFWFGTFYGNRIKPGLFEVRKIRRKCLTRLGAFLVFSVLCASLIEAKIARNYMRWWHLRKYNLHLQLAKDMNNWKRK